MTQDNTREALLQAIARGWCHPGCTDIEMDVRLAEAIADEVGSLVAALTPPSPAQSPGQPAQAAANGGKTGSPPGLLQDDCRGLSKALSATPNARQDVRDACAGIEAQRAALQELADMHQEMGVYGVPMSAERVALHDLLETSEVLHKMARHKDGCRRPRGDQWCECGLNVALCNYEDTAFEARAILAEAGIKEKP